MMLVAPVALAAPRHPEVYPVPAPEVKTVPEHEEAPGPMKFWDTHVLNNEQPPLAALSSTSRSSSLIYYRFGKKPVADGARRTARRRSRRRSRTRRRSSSEAKHALEERTTRSSRRSKPTPSKASSRTSRRARATRRLIVRARRGEGRSASQRDAEFLLEQEKKQTRLDLVRETVERAATRSRSESFAIEREHGRPGAPRRGVPRDAREATTQKGLRS